MSTQSNYDQIAANLDYAKIAKMLTELTKLPPPKTQITVADVLAPIIGRLRDLHAKGWTYDQLSKELNEFGLPINTSALRRHLRTRRKRRSKRDVPSPSGSCSKAG